MKLQDGDLVIVSSLAKSNFYRHYSVYADGYFYHFNETGVHCDTFNRFFKKQKRSIIRIEHGGHNKADVLAYYFTNAHKQYDPVFYNCEHFATECAFGRAYSPTLRGYLLLLYLFVIVIVIVIQILK